jgi:hypothetical protein
MTIRREQDGTIYLEDHCTVEDAEPLLQMLLATPAAPVDWRRSGRIHTAVIQVLLTARPQLIGPSGDSWVRAWIGDRI